MSDLESQLARLGPMGATVDVIEEQQDDILNALKKLSKYNHHIQLFTQVSHLSLYSRSSVLLHYFEECKRRNF